MALATVALGLDQIAGVDTHHLRPGIQRRRHVQERPAQYGLILMEGQGLQLSSAVREALPAF